MAEAVATTALLAPAERPRVSWSACWPLIIAAATFLVFDNGGRLFDADTYLHIAAGRWMLAHGVVPDHDPFSEFMRGAPWVSHEWLAELILAVAYRIGGWAAVVGLSTACFAAAAALLTRFLLRHLQPVHVLGVVALGELLAMPHLSARPHVLAMPLMVLWTAALVDAATAGRPPRWTLLPVMTLWANLHGGFTLGLGFAGLLAVEAVANAPTREEALARLRGWGGFLAAMLASVFVSPHPIGGLEFTTKVLSLDYSLGIIEEWQSPNFHALQPLELWLLIAIALALTKGLRLPPIRLLLLLGLVHLGLKYMRSGELVGFLAPLVAAGPLAPQLARSAGASALDRIFERLTLPAPRAALAAGVAVMALSALVIAQARPLRPDASISPAAAVAAARAAGLKGPVFNDYNFGGYLVFSGIAPYIDGRADMYGDAYMHEMGNAVSMAKWDALPKLLDSRKIGWTLLRPGSTAAKQLDHLPGWRVVYRDDVAVVHARTVPAEAAGG